MSHNHTHMLPLPAGTFDSMNFPAETRLVGYVFSFPGKGLFWERGRIFIKSSMYGIFTYIYHRNQPNASIYI